jgi:hypothetical protein
MEAVDKIREYNVETQIYVGRSNIPVARSELLTNWWRTHKDGDIFFFLDADHTFAVQDIRSILALDADVKCGIYANSEGTSTASFVNPEGFYNGTDNRVLLAGCGLMGITWSIVNRLSEKLTKVHVSDQGEPIFPFFQHLIVQEGSKQFWLSEDKSFCYLVNKHGGVLRGFSSPTIGHEVYKIETL